jgi:GT2 family glycosyltransferase
MNNDKEIRMKIAAVVVTYNRLTLLKECIDGLRKQTYKIDEIIVVNNDSNDGTLEWFNTQKDITVITQENLGSAGGFYTGIEYAKENQYNWIWLMDDDVEPESDCLLKLFDIAKKHNYSVLQPSRLIRGTGAFWSYGSKFNFTNPFRAEGVGAINSLDIKGDYCNIVSIPFEGPLINVSVFNKLNNVDKEYFMFYDDTDFSLRLYNNHNKIALVKKAILIKKIINNNSNSLSIGFREYYQIRNSIILDATYGSLYIKYTRLVARMIKLLVRILMSEIVGKRQNISSESFKLVCLAIKHGISGKKGKLAGN